jgi:GAF domain-containing protein
MLEPPVTSSPVTFGAVIACWRDLARFAEARTSYPPELAAAVEIDPILSLASDLDMLLANAIEFVCTRFDLYYAQIFLIDNGRYCLKMCAGSGPIGLELLQRGHRLPFNPGSASGTAAAERRPVFIADTANGGMFWPNPLLPDARSEMALPLMLGKRLLGVLDLWSTQPGALTVDCLPAVDAVASMLAHAIGKYVLVRH